MDHMAELSNTIFDSGLIGKEVITVLYTRRGILWNTGDEERIELTREKVREAIVHKAVRKYQRD